MDEIPGEFFDAPQASDPRFGEAQPGDPEVMEQSPPPGIPVAMLQVLVKVQIDAYGNVLPGAAYQAGLPPNMPPPPEPMIVSALHECVKAMYEMALDKVPT